MNYMDASFGEGTNYETLSICTAHANYYLFQFVDEINTNYFHIRKRP